MQVFVVIDFCTTFATPKLCTWHPKVGQRCGKVGILRKKTTYYQKVMNISYKWLKEYVDFDMSAHEVAEALTSIGLEVGSVEEIQAIKGGLEGLCTGEVLT